MSETAIAEAPATKPRKAPHFGSADIKIDSIGTFTKSIIARAPANMTAQDLNDPTVWRVIQSMAEIALTRLDRVLVVGEGWAVDALVSESDATTATLAFNRVLTLHSRSGSSWVSADGKFSIRFVGNGFNVVRDDGVVVSPSPFPNVPSALGWLQSKNGPMKGAA